MRLAIMDTNAFNTIIAAVKGAVSASISRPMYKNMGVAQKKAQNGIRRGRAKALLLFLP